MQRGTLRHALRRDCAQIMHHTAGRSRSMTRGLNGGRGRHHGAQEARWV
jgi:hypothetical protein